MYVAPSKNRSERSHLRRLRVSEVGVDVELNAVEP